MSLPDRTRAALERAAAVGERRGKPPPSPPVAGKEVRANESAPEPAPVPVAAAPPPVPVAVAVTEKTEEPTEDVKKENEPSLPLGAFAVGQVRSVGAIAVALTCVERRKSWQCGLRTACGTGEMNAKELLGFLKLCVLYRARVDKV